MARLAAGALLLAAAQAVVFVNDQGQLDVGMHPLVTGSTPGSPWIQPRALFPYKSRHDGRMQMGNRLFQSTMAPEQVANCSGFVSFGKFTWCKKAMPTLAAGLTEKDKVRGLSMEAMEPITGPRPNARSMFGVSVGIRERDLWSELMSNRYSVPSQLFDCYMKQDRGPMGTHDFLLGNMENASDMCPEWTHGICYTEPYQPNKICLGEKKQAIKSTDGRTLEFDTLPSILEKRGPLSTFLKLDVEGSEWASLELLLGDEETMGKIRSLDLEINMDKYVKDGRQLGLNELEKKVEIMEGLAEKFAVVGSTISSTHAKMQESMGDKLMDEPKIYSSDGVKLDQFAISYVNRALI